MRTKARRLLASFTAAAMTMIMVVTAAPRAEATSNEVKPLAVLSSGYTDTTDDSDSIISRVRDLSKLKKAVYNITADARASGVTSSTGGECFAFNMQWDYELTPDVPCDIEMVFEYNPNSAGCSYAYSTVLLNNGASCTVNSIKYLDTDGNILAEGNIEKICTAQYKCTQADIDGWTHEKAVNVKKAVVCLEAQYDDSLGRRGAILVNGAEKATYGGGADKTNSSGVDADYILSYKIPREIEVPVELWDGGMSLSVLDSRYSGCSNFTYVRYIKFLDENDNVVFQLPSDYASSVVDNETYVIGYKIMTKARIPTSIQDMYVLKDGTLTSVAPEAAEDKTPYIFESLSYALSAVKDYFEKHPLPTGEVFDWRYSYGSGGSGYLKLSSYIPAVADDVRHEYTTSSEAYAMLKGFIDQYNSQTDKNAVGSIVTFPSLRKKSDLPPGESADPVEPVDPIEPTVPDEPVIPENPSEPIPDDGKVIVETPEIGEGAPETKIENPESVKSAVGLTPEEKTAVENGADVKITLSVEKADGKLTPEEKEEIENKAPEGFGVGVYLDIKMDKQVGNLVKRAVTELLSKIEITVAVPADIINTDENTTREYIIIHMHNGSTEIINGKFDPVNNTFTFPTDKFSTYAIAYKDTPKEKEPEPVIPVYSVTVNGNASVNGAAAEGSEMTVTMPIGFTARVYNGSTLVATIRDSGKFTMPAGNVVVNVTDESGAGMMAYVAPNTYIYSYDSSMKLIKTSRSKKGIAGMGEMTVDLGAAYAGRTVTLYSGKKSTSEKITETVLDSKGRATFTVKGAKNYTLVVED